jgi:hypothetical protein
VFSEQVEWTSVFASERLTGRRLLVTMVEPRS